MGKNKHKKHHRHDEDDEGGEGSCGGAGPSSGLKLILKVGASSGGGTSSKDKHKKKKKKKEKKKDRDRHGGGDKKDRHHKKHHRRSSEKRDKHAAIEMLKSRGSTLISGIQSSIQSAVTESGMASEVTGGTHSGAGAAIECFSSKVRSSITENIQLK